MVRLSKLDGILSNRQRPPPRPPPPAPT
eukprot:SAG31_NODE_32295_length_357_cov_1.182171_1_plen_27_part_10